MKKFLAIVMVAVMAVMCTACGGLDMSKVKGDWTLSTVNGQSVADYAASLGVDESGVAVNWTVSDKSVTVANSAMSASYDIEVKSNGFEVKEGGAVIMSVTYDDKNASLSYAVEVDGTKYDYVLKKGTASFDAPADDTADDTADEEYSDEEYSDEEYAEEDYSEEEYVEE